MIGAWDDKPFCGRESGFIKKYIYDVEYCQSYIIEKTNTARCYGDIGEIKRL